MTVIMLGQVTSVRLPSSQTGRSIRHAIKQFRSWGSGGYEFTYESSRGTLGTPGLGRDHRGRHAGHSRCLRTLDGQALSLPNLEVRTGFISQDLAA